MVGGNLCVLWSTSGGDTRGGALLTVWSSRAIRRGRAASGRRQTSVGGLCAVLAGGVGVRGVGCASSGVRWEVGF